MKKLELKHLAPYLPYGLKGMSKNETVFLLSTYQNMGCFIENRTIDTFLNDGYKPILRPLSDLTKEIKHNGEKFVPYIKANWSKRECDMYILGQKNINQAPYWFTEKLLEWHFDIFGLIEAGLAIDINTLEK